LRRPDLVWDPCVTTGALHTLAHCARSALCLFGALLVWRFACLACVLLVWRVACLARCLFCVLFVLRVALVGRFVRLASRSDCVAHCLFGALLCLARCCVACCLHGAVCCTVICFALLLYVVALRCCSAWLRCELRAMNASLRYRLGADGLNATLFGGTLCQQSTV
jgi:hypothetical protein